MPYHDAIAAAETGKRGPGQNIPAFNEYSGYVVRESRETSKIESPKNIFILLSRVLLNESLE
jgi:hypothetical protein